MLAMAPEALRVTVAAKSVALLNIRNLRAPMPESIEFLRALLKFDVAEGKELMAALYKLGGEDRAYAQKLFMEASDEEREDIRRFIVHGGPKAARDLAKKLDDGTPTAEELNEWL